MKFFTTVILVFVLFASCKKEPTSWGSNWVAPIFNDTLDITNFVNDSTLAINNDESVQLILDREIFSFDLFEMIDLPDTSLIQEFTISVSSLNLSPGTNYVDDVQNNEFDIDGAVVTKARVKRGDANIEIENPLETKTIFEIELPGVTKNGVTFSQVETVPAAGASGSGKSTFNFDLSGYSIDMRGDSGNSSNIIQSRMKAKTDPDGASVVITDQDVIRFKVDIIDLKLDYAKGYFGSVDITDTTELEVDFLKNITSGNLVLDEIDLKLQIFNGLKVIGQGNITKFDSENKSGDLVSLTHPNFNQLFNIDVAQGEWGSLTPSETAFEFDNNNSSIQPFLEHLGYKYHIGYGVYINPWGNTSSGNDEIFPNSSIDFRLKANFPLKVGLNDLTLVDTFEVDIAEQDNFAQVKSGRFILNTENSFPFGGNVILSLLNEDGEELNTITADGQINPATLNSAQNQHIPVKDELFFEVDEEVVDQLPDMKYVKVIVNMVSTSQNDNQVYSNALLKLNLKTNFELESKL
ncbi:MAG: hypothetical protein WED10_07830 [Brumimicrobium sp.]